MKLAWLFIFAAAIQLSAGAKILTLVPMPARSHYNLFSRLVVELAEKGHEVTIVSGFKQSKPVKNLKEIVLPDLYQNLTAAMASKTKNADGTEQEDQGMFAIRKMSPWLFPIISVKMGPAFMDMILSTEEMQNLIKSNEKFDLILGEAFMQESVLGGFSARFKAPIIGVATFMPNIWSNFMVGNPAPAAYIPDPQLGFTNRMTFCERVMNFLYGLENEIAFTTFYMSAQDEIMRKYFGEDLPPLEDILKNTSLVLVNHHYSLAFPRPYLPNMIEIGGYHINPPKPLPADLEKYFNQSKEGVILFSMGSHLKSKQLPNEKKQAILKAFSKLKENVLWKYEDDTLTDIPKNVKISKWLPQSDILAHPNLKLFITHGGLLSTTEAVTRGVPMVGIPIAGDQPLNMKYTSAAGFGVTVEFDDLNEEILYNAIIEVLNNPKYKENVMQGSVLIQDNPLSAMDTALYWIEYVIRHKGAPHLRSAAQDLKWYQLYLLDVYAVFAIISLTWILVSFYVTRLVIKRLLGLFCKKSKKVSAKKKDN